MEPAAPIFTDEATLPLTRCWCSIHAFPQVAYIQLPPFEELRYVSHTLHHRQSISFTEYRNSSAGSFYVGFTLALV